MPFVPLIILVAVMLSNADFALAFTSEVDALGFRLAIAVEERP